MERKGETKKPEDVDLTLAGALASVAVAATTMLSGSAPAFGGMTEAQRVALVEEVKGQVTGIEFMDYVAPGTVIKLGPRDTIVLTYVKSCWRETITGGTVVIGVERSWFHLSTVEGVEVDCDNGGHSVTQQQRTAAGTVFRGIKAP